MTDVHQCPFCELRFPAKWELQSHLDTDHPGRVNRPDQHVVVEEPDVDDPRPL